MATTITIRDNSVTVDRDIEEILDLDYARTYTAVKDDKTFLVANLLAPKVEELMDLSMDELRNIHLGMIVGGK